MKNFDIDTLIQEERITTVSPNFLQQTEAKLLASRSRRLSSPVFKGMHLKIAVAAGIVLGFFMVNLQKHAVTSQQDQHLTSLFEKYHMDDLEMEPIEKSLFE